MAMSSKFDLSSGSPDRPLYTSGQRGSHLAAQLDRSSSFRESMENPILASLPNMSRGSSVVTQGDVSSFFQCLRFDPKDVVADHKSNRPGEFRRHVNIALGVPVDDSPNGLSKGKPLLCPVPEEIKRAKAGLRENSVKARERMKLFSEALSVFNKCFPSIPSKKRSRSESFANDQRSALLSSERSVLGPNLSKTGIHSHAMPGGFELESEERTKTAVPNKRTRTSLVDVKGMDVRSNALVRPPGSVDRDREMLRLANSGSVQGEDRTLSISVDGWDKSKMKKRRSGIKPETSQSFVSPKPTDGYREPKQGLQQRPVTDARSRINESHSFRPGVANGAVGVGKSDGISQQTGLGARASIPKTELDNNSILNDRRDRSTGSDKERVNFRAVNKMNARDEFNSASPSSNTKINASVRAPRSVSVAAPPKLSPGFHRATAPNEWELSHCINKPPVAVGANHRKRTVSARSSSPPVHWASQRSQKNSRTARRTNLVPIVSNNDKTPALDASSDVAGNEVGMGFVKRLPGNSPQQVKLKGDPLSSSAVSESEESGTADIKPDIKPKDKGRKFDEVVEKAGLNVQKMSTLVLPSRKNKLVSGEDLGDGVRRQGRTGRVSTSARTLMPMTVGKLSNVGTAKQLRSARLGFDKTESKAGRPPTRKLSDRRAYKRQKHSSTSTAADFLVGSDDGHEELLAAANAVINSAHALSPFWRQTEPLFGFLSDEEFAYLRQQGNLESATPTQKLFPSNTGGCTSVPSGLAEQEREVGRETARGDLLMEQLVTGARSHAPIPLYQRFIAALIIEEDYSSENEDFKIDAYGVGFELDAEIEPNVLDHLLNFQPSEHTGFNSYRITGKGNIDDEPEIDILGISSSRIKSNFGQSLNGVLPDQASIPGMIFSEFQYDSMQMNEKLRLEARSVGIFPESLLEDSGISDEIKKLEKRHHEQVSKKQVLLDKLLKLASEVKELQEKEFEQRALDELVAMAYEKYMTCRGSNATGGKSSSNKMAKQAALAFVKRTLERCHKYEDTGKSCFSEQLFKDMFLSGYSHLNGGQPRNPLTDGESAKSFANTSGHSLEVRVSASMGSQPSPSTSQLGQNGDSSDMLPATNRSSEQSTSKEDTWSNRVKKRELLLDDVVGTIGTSTTPSGIGSSLSSSTKGKRSERDRDGKGHSREVLSRNGTIKIGRPALSNAKGERKSKTKPKQKITQLSVSVNGLPGKMSEQPKLTASVSKSSEVATNSNAKEKDEFNLDVLDGSDPILSQISLDVLGGPDGHAQDLGSWLNIEDDALQDHDFMGLEIPMDDLSDLNMMV
ncbi:uncharacterized protein LOC123200517 isoform X2 [Mangifera indica]|uniref:uncharacterized protein LOC123200517 isoform X2 n=1 Tax=Mangifera indica TaxID=29780 RepID=UPI001CFBDDA1|nr:uncharacterized protein LOC123200517 isoform X2 [Mangifera indica]